MADWNEKGDLAWLPIFAYLRRSTTNKQEISIENQADNIDLIIKDNGFNKDEIVFFQESKSAYEGIKQKNGQVFRKRTEFTKMLKAIDSSKDRCVILVRDSSRLSRNKLDSLEITKRLFGEFWNKKKIEQIIFYWRAHWDSNSNKINVDDELQNNYHESITTWKRSQDGVVAQLRRGYFVYNPPAGLVKVKGPDKSVLLQRNEKMPFVLRAFEMKTEGKSHKEISKYLRIFGGIKIWERDLTDKLFRKTIYIGSYTYEKTGEVFDGILFTEGKPPIPTALWNSVQKCVWKKISQYWEKQDEHLFQWRIKSESGHIFSTYAAKGKYLTYKGKFKDWFWRESFLHVSEGLILSSCLTSILWLLHTFSEWYKASNLIALTDTSVQIAWGRLVYSADSNHETGKVAWLKHVRRYEVPLDASNSDEENVDVRLCVKSSTILAKDLFVWVPDDVPSPVSDQLAIVYKGSLFSIFSVADKIGDSNRGLARKSAIEEITTILRKEFGRKNEDYLRVKEEQLRKMNADVSDLEQEKKSYRRNALKMGYSKEEIEETTADIEKSINLIKEEIYEISKGDEMERYLERLPEVLLKIVELTGNAIGKAKTEEMRDDIKKLLELTTVELTVTNKKELRIKLFDVLDVLLSRGKSALEAPSGVEPLSTALQAAV